MKRNLCSTAQLTEQHLGDSWVIIVGQEGLCESVCVLPDALDEERAIEVG